MSQPNPAYYGAAPYPGQQFGGPPQGTLLAIGDITVTDNQIVTPRGTAPLAGSQWMINDRSIRTSTTPTWAIVLAILLFWFFLFSLLLLLVKETRIEGFFEVTVTSGNLFHTTYLPAWSAQGNAAFQQVQYAQYLAQRAG